MPKNFKSFAQLIQDGYDQISIVQSLWSGYGNLYRLKNKNGSSVIVKHINPPGNQNHPRKWNSSVAHQRKLKSYNIEYHWYKEFGHLTNNACRIPKLLYAESQSAEQILVLEDLAYAGYPSLKNSIPLSAVKVILGWLANFHGTFLGKSSEGLWDVGSYWNLETRPDEYAAMKESELKKYAFQIGEKLNNCNFKTIIHGDAKLANFCFSKDLSKVAAVDFQYVGGGCGMKDVAYFLGSCLSDSALKDTEEELLSFYFETLQKSITKTINFEALREEWTILYPAAWADFERFLSGWAPRHHKRNNYTEMMTIKTLKTIK